MADSYEAHRRASAGWDARARVLRYNESLRVPFQREPSPGTIHFTDLYQSVRALDRGEPHKAMSIKLAYYLGRDDYVQEMWETVKQLAVPAYNLSHVMAYASAAYEELRRKAESDG